MISCRVFRVYARIKKLFKKTGKRLNISSINRVGRWLVVDLALVAQV